MEFGPSDDDVQQRRARQADRPFSRRRRRQPSPTKTSADEETDVEELSSAVSDMELEDADTDDEEEVEEDAPQTLAIARRPRRHRPRAGRRRGGAGATVVATLQLAREVEALRRRRDELMAIHTVRVLNTDRRDRTVNMTIEYYDTFRDGFTGPRLPEMLEYLHHRMDGDVFEFGTAGLGLAAMVEQWRLYTRLLDSFSIRLRGTHTSHLLESPEQLREANSDATMTASMTAAEGFVCGTLSRHSICTLVPHIRHREDLVQKLLGKSFSCPMTLTFFFNSAGHIHRLDFGTDYFQAFSNVEGVSLADLEQITEQIAVGDNSEIQDLVEREEELCGALG